MSGTLIATDTLAAPRAAEAAAVELALSVGVIVSLYRYPGAGGHVKSWERLAEAAAGVAGLDLTVYFLGQRAGTESLATNVRLRTLRPVMASDRFRILGHMPDHTDLAPLHPPLLRHLRRHHVVHTTDAFFSMARTALYYSRWKRRPLVNSIHTDTPAYTRLYSAQVLLRLFGGGRLGRTVRDRWRWDQRLAHRMHRRLAHYLGRCDWTFGARDASSPGRNGKRSSILRRGVNKDLFHPALRDRQRLREEFGIPADRAVLLFVGRVDAGKEVLTLAHAARALLDRGADLHVIFAGEGSQKDEVRRLLGARAALPGAVPQERLAWLYASADLFVFPSRIEIAPNAVLEARAAGLPALVSGSGGSGRLIASPGPAADEDGLIIPNGDPRDWAAAIAALLDAPRRRQAMGRRARRHIERHWPSWSDVLAEDLLPVWQRVARERGVWSGAAGT
jgi:glycosyltransferase involved in cell wall biosynthesis